MYKNLIFFLFIAISIINESSYKLPLPKGALKRENLPVEQIDNNDLKGRPCTIIDTFNERFLYYKLTPDQQTVFNELNQRQNIIIDKTRVKYLNLIAKAKQERFNRSAIVCKLIDRYERILPSLVTNDQEIKDLIAKFLKVLKE